ncbi:astacin-like metalloendopeptidase isoform X2 [Ambystoma mexicanum]|uniref:astacin-like metalloendopeptidase isoform X2 n=1 Tax=Ambystoma mexicanum TaxID=8296 RepID=UPI0037E80C5F
MALLQCHTPCLSRTIMPQRILCWKHLQILGPPPAFDLLSARAKRITSQSYLCLGYLRDFCMYNTTNLIVSYDLLSILHYSRFAFSRTGAQTIVPKYPNKNAAIGQRIALSASDVLRVNKYYQCPQAGSQADVGDLDMDLPAVPDYTCTDGKVNIVPSEGPPYEITFIENADLRGPTVQSALPIGGPSVPSSMPVTMPTASTTILAEELTVTTTMPEKVSSVLTGMSLEGLVVRNSVPSNSFSKMAFFTARQGSNVTTAMAMVKYIASQSMRKSVISHKRSPQVPTVGNFEPQLAHTNPFPLSSLEVPISTTIYTLEDSVHAAATVEKFPVLMTAPTQGLLASSVGFSIPSATFKEGATNSVAANSDSHSIRRRAVGQHSSLRLPNTEVNNTLKALWALGGTYWPLEEPIAQNRKCVEHLSRNMVSEFSTIKDQGLKHFMVLGSCVTKRESGQNRKFGHVRKHQRLHSSPHWKDQEFSSVRDKSDLFKVFPHKEDLTTSLESTKLPVYKLAAASVAPADHVRKRSPVVQRTVPHHAHPRRTRKLAGERLLPVPPRLFCNFEDGLCGWKLKQNAHSQRICRKERLIFGGPERDRDHPRINDSFPAGCYVSLKTSSDGHADGQRASLVSPLLRGIWCLSFWHKLHGSNTGSLNMYLHVVAPPEVWHWVLHLQKRSHWVYKEVPLLEKQNEDVFQVKLESAAGLAPGSWIDIDDLLLWRC